MLMSAILFNDKFFVLVPFLNNNPAFFIKIFHLQAHSSTVSDPPPTISLHLIS